MKLPHAGPDGCCAARYLQRMEDLVAFAVGCSCFFEEAAIADDIALSLTNGRLAAP